MGKSFNTGLLTNGIAQDSSNNIGIGGAANASYKLAVTGASLFTGAGTFSSSVTANDTLSINTDVTMLRFGNLTRWGFQRPAADNRYVSFMRNMNATANPVWTVDGDNGNVGIGTNSPTGILQVQNVQDGVSGKNLTLAYNGTYYAEFTEKSIRAYNNELIIGTGTGGAERMRITSSGNVEIQSGSLIAKSTGTGTPAVYLRADSGSNNGTLGFGNSTDYRIRGGSDYAAMIFDTAGTERMRISSVGNLQFNSVNTSAAYIEINQAPSQDGGIVWRRNLSNRFQQALSNSDGMLFYSYGIATNAFIINYGGSASLYGSLTQNASDRRLKNNIQNIPNALDKINAINGVTFEWDNTIYKTDRTKDVGIIAQEVQAILPEAVTLAPFDTNDDGTSKSGENYLTAYYEKLIPLLIEGIKELSAKVTALENR